MCRMLTWHLLPHTLCVAFQEVPDGGDTSAEEISGPVLDEDTIAVGI